MGIPDHLICLLRNLYAGQEATVRTRHGSRSGKEYVKALYCHPAYLSYMQRTSCKMLGWMKHKLESRLLGEISITSDMQMTPPLWQNEEELKNLLMKEESEKVDVSWTFKKTNHGMQSHHFIAHRWGNSGWLYFWRFQNHWRLWLSHEIKRHLLLGRQFMSKLDLLKSRDITLPTKVRLVKANCCILTCIQISQEAGQVDWYSHLLRIFHSLLW